MLRPLERALFVKEAMAVFRFFKILTSCIWVERHAEARFVRDLHDAIFDYEIVFDNFVTLLNVTTHLFEVFQTSTEME